MVEQRAQRRLAAILAADVVGYSRLMEADEEDTLRRLQGAVQEVVTPVIAEHNGRLVKTTGDGLLAEFMSVVDAVRCAAALQARQGERDADLPADRRLRFRIGINLGDVMVEGGDIFGDGVNVAARLEGLADTGGILLSGTAYDQVKKQADLGFAFLGEQRVKNIADPVRVYRVLTEPKSAGRTISGYRPLDRRLRVLATMVAALIAVILISGLAWWRPWQTSLVPASVERMAYPLPDKPSIAVLPFANMSDDPKQDYFADGITDDLITELSHVSGLFVISRNSTFVYKDRAVPPRQVSEELGVRYVLEGSVQRAGDRLRINAQLIDALNGGHEWAEKFDGSLADVFALQDKVTRSVADALAVRLTDMERETLGQQETTVAAAYDAFLRGWEYYRRTTQEDYAEAIPHFEEAIKLDPDYGRAYAALAMVYLRIYENLWAGHVGPSLVETRDSAIEYLNKAEKHPTTLSHQAAGMMHLWMESRPDLAIENFKEAIGLDPGDPLSYAYLGAALTVAVRPTEAISYLRTAMRLDPHYPSEFVYFLGLAQFSLERFEDAAASFESATKLNPDDERAFVVLAAAYGHLGRKQGATSAIARYNAIRIKQGDIPLTMQALAYYLVGFRNFNDIERVRKGLQLAGLPATLLDGEFAKQNRLTASELRTLLLGHRLHGRTLSTGREYAASITMDGDITMSGVWGWSGTGVIQFESDQLCIHFGTYVAGCVNVLQNPGGTRSNENEYIWIEDDAAFPFSRVE